MHSCAICQAWCLCRTAVCAHTCPPARAIDTELDALLARQHEAAGDALLRRAFPDWREA